jgi:hypothetical protein
MTETVQKMTWDDFAARYCKTQVSTPEELAAVLREQLKRFGPRGFFLAEAQLMDSSYAGTVVILPFGGPENTYKEIPSRPFSPRGLASDTSVVIGYVDAGDVPGEEQDV